LPCIWRFSYGEVLRCLLEGLRWLSWPSGTVPVTGKSGISQARTRLGVEPVKQLYEHVVHPIAKPRTKGARYRRWRLVSIDGSTLNVADTAENAAAFGRPGASRGQSAYPQLRFVSLVENGSRGRTNPRAVKQKVGKFPIRHRQKCAPSTFRIIYANHIVIIK
jgi:hypothetical protein